MVIADEILEKLRHTILEIGVDYRVEALVSALIKYGLHPDQVIIQPLSTAKRACRKEVSDFHTEQLSYDNKEYVFLHTHRDGLYDALPENVFHQPTRGKTEKNKYEVIDEIKKHRQEEKNARAFFLPFEYEYNHVKSILYRLEEDFEKNIDNSKLIKIFSEGWPILKKLDTRHAYIFFRIIPLIHAIRNDFDLISKSISLILGIDVRVSLYKHQITHNLYEPAAMGNAQLGINTTLAGKVDDGEEDVKVSIGPLTPQQVNDYAKGGKNEDLIEDLMDYFVSANYYIYKEFVIDRTITQFKLDNQSVVLGANAVL